MYPVDGIIEKITSGRIYTIKWI